MAVKSSYEAAGSSSGGGPTANKRGSSPVSASLSSGSELAPYTQESLSSALQPQPLFSGAQDGWAFATSHDAADDLESPQSTASLFTSPILRQNATPPAIHPASETVSYDPEYCSSSAGLPIVKRQDGGSGKGMTSSPD